VRIAVMVLLLVAALAVWFWPLPRPLEPKGPAVRVVEPALPALDPARLSGEGALDYLLRESVDVVPAYAAALRQPATVKALRDDPLAHRGRYVSIGGTLQKLLLPRPGHPLPRYQVHEAHVAADGGVVVLWFSLPPDPALQAGARVRAEGFFCKLHDDPVHGLAQVPLLVGPELLLDPETWPPVTTLSPQVLDRVQDGDVDAGGKVLAVEDMGLGLEQSQAEPLWHLCSHARHAANQPAGPSPPRFDEQNDWNAWRSGTLARGERRQVGGAFRAARVLPAAPNPIGVTHFSEVWVQCAGLGGRLLPLWIPDRIGERWRQDDSVSAPAYYFRRLLYESETGQQRTVPVFVAATIVEPRLELGSVDRVLRAGFVAGSTLVVVLLLAAGWRRRQREGRR
jgi:hypothetical protein